MVLLAFKGVRAPNWSVAPAAAGTSARNTGLKRTGELMAFCPSCKSFETIWFDDGTLMSTRKFSQRGDLVFHDCGSTRPCRLYRNS